MERPGIEVLQSDVVEVIRKAQSQYDCIIVDVDNGPTAMVLPAFLALANMLLAVFHPFPPRCSGQAPLSWK